MNDITLLDINELLRELKKDNSIYEIIKDLENQQKQEIKKPKQIKQIIQMNQTKQTKQTKQKNKIDTQTDDISQIQILWPLDFITEIPKLNKIAVNKTEMIDSINLDDFIKISDKYVISGKIIENVVRCVNIPSFYDIATYDKSCYDKLNELIKTNPERYENIRLNKTIYSSLKELLLDIQNPVYRFGYDGLTAEYYGTNMFYIELYKLLNDTNLMKTNIYFNEMNNQNQNQNQNQNLLHDIVNELNYDKLIALHNKGLIDTNNYHERLKYGLTPIERVVQLYKKSDNLIIKSAAVNIIVTLSASKYVYKRHPLLFAQCVLAHELYDILSKVKCKYNSVGSINITESTSNIIDSINIETLNNLFALGDVNYIVDYIEYIGYENVHYMLNIVNIENTLVKNTSNNVRDVLIKISGSIEKYQFDNIILHYELIDLYRTLEIKPNYTENYITYIFPQLIIKKKYISILFILKQFNISDMIKSNISGIDIKVFFKNPLYTFVVNLLDESSFVFLKMVTLLMKYNVNIFNEIDFNGNTILHYIAQIKPLLLYDTMDYFLSLNINILQKNNDKETFFHILCSNKNKKISNSQKATNIKNILEKLKNKNINNGINEQNIRGETILILSIITRQEELYKILLGYGSNDMIEDIYGNTVYHYICLNDMLIGSIIKTSTNKYGYKPSDFTKLKNYWKFT